LGKFSKALEKNGPELYRMLNMDFRELHILGTRVNRDKKKGRGVAAASVLPPSLAWRYAASSYSKGEGAGPLKKLRGTDSKCAASCRSTSSIDPRTTRTFSNSFRRRTPQRFARFAKRGMLASNRWHNPCLG
jgi:hypothetical protein